MQKIEQIARTKIEPDPDQPRKYFDPAKLAELATSIEAHGVRSPLEVRPHPRKKDSFVITTGERRWRASEIAGLEAVPCIVVMQDDAKVVLELQLIENSQRVDIGPLEEGETYKRLEDEHGHTIETLMAKTGRSRSHVYARMKLTTVTPAVKKAIQEGKLEPTIGDLIATIGDPKLQDLALKDCLGISDWNSYRSANVEPERTDNGHKNPLSFRAARELIRNKYKLRLAGAPFFMDDAKLTSAGACTTCPNRSGNQPELPGVSASTKADDMCQLPSCFQEKVQAQFVQRAEHHRAMGLLVIPKKDAEKLRVFNYSGEVAYDSPWVEAKAEIPWSITGDHDSKATWKGQLGAKLASSGLQRAYVQDPTGAGRELINRDEAVKILRDMGKLKKQKPASSSSTSNDPDMKKERAEQRDQEKLRAAAFEQFLRFAVRGAAGDIAEKKELAFWRLLGRLLSRDLFFDRQNRMADRRDGKVDPDDIEKLPDKMKTAGEARGFVVELALEALFETLINDHIHETPKDVKADIAAVESLFGTDWKKSLEIARLAAEHDALSMKESKEAAKPAKKAGAK